MKITRQLQVVALVLTIIAGWLWSQKVGRLTYQQSVSSIHTSIDDQLETLSDRMASQTDLTELIRIGRSFLNSKSPRFAIVALSRATEVDPTYRDGWYLLGYAYTQAANQIAATGDQTPKSQYLDKAVNALNQAKKLDPHHQPTLDLLNELQK